MLDFCPHCNIDLRAERIPEENLMAGFYGPWDGVEVRYFYKTIGVYSRSQDRTMYWQCPACNGTWDR